MFRIGEFVTGKPNIRKYAYTNDNSICQVVRHEENGEMCVRIVGYKKPTILDWAIGEEYDVEPQYFIQLSARMG